MQSLYIALLSFLTAVCAFARGARKLFRRRKPMYFQLLVCASGCFALQQLSAAVRLWCGAGEGNGIGMLGIFGCNFFLLSANYGTLDRIVDDGTDSKKARTLALLAPLVLLLPMAAALRGGRSAIPRVLMLLPALPASYFNLKHILLPPDPCALLRATKPCNFAALAFYLFSGAYLVLSVRGGLAADVSALAISFAMLALTLCAERGSERWGI